MRAQQEQQQQQQQSMRFYPRDDDITVGPPKAMLSVEGHQGMMGDDAEYVDRSQPTKGGEEEEKEELALPPPPYDVAIDEVKVGSSYEMSK